MIKPEKKLQDKAVKYLKGRGIYYLNLYGDGMSGKGKPDIIACINGLFVAFELKVGENDLQDDQKIHRLRIERSEGLHYAPYTLEEFVGIVEELSTIERPERNSKCQKMNDITPPVVKT